MYGGCSDLCPLLYRLFRSFFIKCVELEKKKIVFPENRFKHEHFPLSPVLISINDLARRHRNS